MKRKRSKQLAGLCLLLAVALSLCACGRSATESRKENDALAKELIRGGSFEREPLAVRTYTK